MTGGSRLRENLTMTRGPTDERWLVRVGATPVLLAYRHELCAVTSARAIVGARRGLLRLSCRLRCRRGCEVPAAGSDARMAINAPPARPAEKESTAFFRLALPTAVMIASRNGQLVTDMAFLGYLKADKRWPGASSTEFLAAATMALTCVALAAAARAGAARAVAARAAPAAPPPAAALPLTPVRSLAVLAPRRGTLCSGASVTPTRRWPRRRTARATTRWWACG